MTYEEAVKYIKEVAGPQNLEYECLEFFHGDLAFDWYGRHGKEPDYGKRAYEALYNWDVC